MLDMRCQARYVLLGRIDLTCDALSDAILSENHGQRLSTTRSLSDVDDRSGAKAQFQSRRLSALGGLTWGNLDSIKQSGFRANHMHLRPKSYEPPANELTVGFCHPGRVLHMLGPKLGKDATVCVDVGDVTLWVSLCMALDKPGQRLLASMRMGTMGYSVCSAIAAWTLRGQEGQHIVAVAGDGGVQMSINELGTAQQLGARFLLIVLVNKKLGRVANEVWGKPGDPPPGGCEITAPDFCKLAAAYGGTGIRLASSEPSKIEAALDKALACKGVCVLEVIQDPDVKPFMAKNSSKVVASEANKDIPVVDDIEPTVQGA